MARAELFLYQTSYLTIKDSDEHGYTLGFPNEEVTTTLQDRIANTDPKGHNYFSSTFLIYTIAVLLPLVVMPFEGSSENIRSSFVAVERGREVSLA